MKRFVLVLAFFVLPAQSRAPAGKDIFLLQLSMPNRMAEELSQVYEPIAARCGEPGSECWVRELPKKTWLLNRVHSSPDASTPTIGTIVGVLAHTEGWPHVRLDYRPHTGTPTVWLADEQIGDWGYGIYVVVRAKGLPAQGDHPVWVQIDGAGSAWIELKPSATDATLLTGELESILDRVLAVEDGIVAVNRRSGRRVRLPLQQDSDEHYVVERLSRDEIFVRKEVGADMPCGDEDEDTKQPTAATPRYRFPIEKLFDKDGKPQLRLAYPRGC